MGPDGKATGELSICIALADATCQSMQHAALLDTADRLRCEQNPALAARADWRASRFLKQRYPAADPASAHAADSRSLSHSHGHAALAMRRPCGPVGVDLEKIRPRDFVALLPQFATDDEVQWWLAQPQPAEAFYRLWTIKEALLKAGGLDFPGDLRRVGLRRNPDARCWHLHAGSSWVLPGPGEHDARRGALGTSQAMMPCNKDMYTSTLPVTTGATPPGEASDAQGDVPQPEATDGTLYWQGISAVLNGQWALACVWLASATPPALHWEPHGNWHVDALMRF